MYNFYINTIEDCNKGCTFCYEKSFSKKKIKISYIKKFFNEAERKFELSEDSEKVKVHFFGGEPTMDIDLLSKAIKYFDNKKYIDSIVIYTNLSCDLDEFISKIKSRHSITIQASLKDDEDPKLFMEKIQSLLLVNFKVIISNVVTGDNAMYIKENVYPIITDYNALEMWDITIARNLKTYKNNVYNNIYNLYTYILEDVLKYKNFEEILGIKRLFNNRKGCLNGDRTFSLGADGRIFGCPHLHYIKEKDVPKKIWDDIQYCELKDYENTGIAFKNLHQEGLNDIVNCPLEFVNSNNGSDKLIEDIREFLKKLVLELTTPVKEILMAGDTNA